MQARALGLCLLVLGLAHTTSALEKLTGEWIPTSRPDAVASSRIVWLYANFTQNANATYTDTQEYAATDDTCRRECAQEATCTGFALGNSVCKRFHLASGPAQTATSINAKATPSRIKTIYTITRITPRGGWQVALYADGATLLAPVAEKSQGAFLIYPQLSIFELTLVPESPLVRLQFVVTERVGYKRITFSNDVLTGIYVGVGMAGGLVFVFFLAFFLDWHGRRSHTHLRS